MNSSSENSLSKYDLSRNNLIFREKYLIGFRECITVAFTLTCLFPSPLWLSEPLLVCMLHITDKLVDVFILLLIEALLLPPDLRSRPLFPATRFLLNALSFLQWLKPHRVDRRFEIKSFWHVDNTLIFITLLVLNFLKCSEKNSMNFTLF